MNMLEKGILLSAVGINVIGFLMMGIDKQKAIKHKWRIPEKTLFLTALLLGSLGIFCGMYVFRHKTRHWYFVIGIPLIFIIQTVAALWICSSIFN